MRVCFVFKRLLVLLVLTNKISLLESAVRTAIVHISSTSKWETAYIRVSKERAIRIRRFIQESYSFVLLTLLAPPAGGLWITEFNRNAIDSRPKFIVSQRKRQRKNNESSWRYVLATCLCLFVCMGVLYCLPYQNRKEKKTTRLWKCFKMLVCEQ